MDQTEQFPQEELISPELFAALVVLFKESLSAG